MSEPTEAEWLEGHDPGTLRDRFEEMTSSDRLSEIRKRREAATPGRWAYGYPEHQGNGNLHPQTNRYGFIADFEYTSDEDAEFIASAPEDIDWLIEQHERLTQAVQDERQNNVNVAAAFEEEVSALRSKLAEVRDWAIENRDPLAHEGANTDYLLAILDREEADRG